LIVAAAEDGCANPCRDALRRVALAYNRNLTEVEAMIAATIQDRLTSVCAGSVRDQAG